MFVLYSFKMFWFGFFLKKVLLFWVRFLARFFQTQSFVSFSHNNVIATDAVVEDTDNDGHTISA